MIGFIAVPILTRIFSPAEYGIYSLVTVTIVLVSPLFHSWLISSAIRFYPEYKKNEDLDVFFSTIFHYMPHFILLFLGIVLPIVFFSLSHNQYRLIICLGILIFVLFTIFNICLGLLRAMQKAWQYMVLFIFVQFCRYLAGAAIAVWLNAGIAGPFWGWAAGLIVVIPIEMIILRIWQYFRWKKKSNKLMVDFFKFGFVLIITGFMAEILSSSDRYMIQAMKGAYQVGLYSVVYTLVTQALGLVAGFLKMSVSPVVTKVYEKEGEEHAVILLGKMTRYFMLLLVPTCTGLYLLRGPVLEVITSPKYYPAQSVMLPLVLGLFVNTIMWIPLMSFFIKKRNMRTLYPMAFAAVLNILLNLVLISRLGYVGAAWATLISYTAAFIIITFMSLKLMRWDFPLLSTFKICLASAVMALSLYGIEHLNLGGAVGLLISIVAGTLVYFISLFMLKGFTISELAFIKQLILKLSGIEKLLSLKRKKRNS